MNSTHSLWCLITGFYRNEMYKDVHCVTGIYIILLLILQLKLDIQARETEDKLYLSRLEAQVLQPKMELLQ